MAKKELIGLYGKFTKATVGAEVDTGTLTENGYYIPTVIGGTSALPTGAAVGYLFQADGTEDITSSGDKVLPITFEDLCDIQKWSLDYSKSEVDVTTLCSTSSKYLAGLPDISGSVEGVYTIGATDVTDGFVNGFVDIVRQADAGGAISIDSINDDPIVAILYKQKDGSSGEVEEFYVAPITITSYSDSVAQGSAQAFSSSFRIAPNDNIKFHLVAITRT